MAAYQTILSNPPFVPVEGVFNFRGVGGYRIPTDPTLRVKPNLLFRSGELTGITAGGAETLTSLNINKAIDLRSETEIGKWTTPSPHLEDIKIEHLPVERKVSFDHDFLTAYLLRFEKDELNAFLEVYKGSLDNLGIPLEAAIRHTIENPHNPFLVYCQAGKDRTGVLVAVILLLLGVSDMEIAEDYSLTEIGLQPANEMLFARLIKVEAFQNNLVGMQNMGTSRVETMMAVIKMI